jgi:hypothetical protein
MDPAAFAPAAADPAGLVAADVPCRKCSYNLRGLAVAGKCPECGTPIGVSIHGNLLRYSDPTWVEKLARGVNLILWGIVASIVGGIAGAVLGETVDRWVGEAVAFLGQLVGLFGAWLLTEPDPGTDEPPQTVTSRRVVRFALLTGLAHNLLMFAADPAMEPVLFRALSIAAIAAAIVGVVGLFAELYYLEILAGRIPDPALAKRARDVRWGFAISYGAMIVLGGIIGLIAATSGQVGGGLFIFGCVVGIAAIVALVYGIIYLIMLFQFNRALKIQADFARHTWAAVVNAPPAIAPPPTPQQL